MATKYPVEQTGVIDGTLNPPNKADGRVVNAQKTVIRATKVAAESWDSGDVIPLGTKGAGQIITGVHVIADATLGTATIDIGIAGAVDKYVDGATVTVANVPVAIGPKASAADDAPGAEEELIATIGVANIAGARTVVVLIELAGL